MTPEDKKKQLKEVAPHIWSMYQHIFEGRTKLENKLNYFLAINTLLLVVALQVLQEELTQWSLLYIVPVIILFLPILLLITNFFSRPLRVPWLEKEVLTHTVDKGTFYEVWIASIFSSAYNSFDYQKRIGKLLGLCISLVAIALVWLLILFILALCASPLTDVERLVVLLLIAGSIGAIVWILLKNKVAFPSQIRTEEVHRFFTEWLDSNGDKTTDKT